MKGKAKRRKRRRGSELQKPANPRWYRVRASQGLKKPSQRHRHYDGSCFVRITTGSARTYLSFQIQVISSLIPSLIIIIIKKKNKKASVFRPKTPASEPERTKKDFISLQGLLLLLFIINFSLLFSIFDLQNQRQSSICPFPFLNFLPVSLSLFSPLSLRYLQTLGFFRGY
jgi:hypothetical protein